MARDVRGKWPPSSFTPIAPRDVLIRNHGVEDGNVEAARKRRPSNVKRGFHGAHHVQTRRDARGDDACVGSRRDGDVQMGVDEAGLDNEARAIDDFLGGR